MSRQPMASPRYPQPWSPRRPSPLGTQPPLAPHMAFASPTFPPTPDRYLMPKGPTENQMRFPPEARRAPLAGSTQRMRAHIPTPLNLSHQLHPPNSQQESTERKSKRRSLIAQQQQPQAQQSYPQKQPSATLEMRVPPSPTPSSTSSLSLYSGDSVKKARGLINEEGGRAQDQNSEQNEKQTSTFCICLNFKSLFGSSSSKKKAKEARILGPQPGNRDGSTDAATNSNTNRRRPIPLNI